MNNKGNQRHSVQRFDREHAHDLDMDSYTFEAFFFNIRFVLVVLLFSISIDDID